MATSPSAAPYVKRHFSTPMVEVDEEDAFETIAKNTLEALKAGRIFTLSALRKDTVGAWV